MRSELKAGLTTLGTFSVILGLCVACIYTALADHTPHKTLLSYADLEATVLVVQATQFPMRETGPTPTPTLVWVCVWDTCAWVEDAS